MWFIPSLWPHVSQSPSEPRTVIRPPQHPENTTTNMYTLFGSRNGFFREGSHAICVPLSHSSPHGKGRREGAVGWTCVERVNMKVKLFTHSEPYIF